MSKSLAFMSLGIPVAALVAWLAFGKARAPGAPGVRSDKAPIGSAAPGAQSEDVNRLEGRITFLQSELASLQEQLARRTPGDTTSTPKASGPTAAPSSTISEKDRLREALAQREADFEAEARDHRWARDTTSAFQDAVTQGPALRAALKSIDCRTTTCRVEMAVDRTPAFQKQLDDLTDKLGPILPSMSYQRVSQPDGTTTTVYFWYKQS
jgi:hypothetical protein